MEAGYDLVADRYAALEAEGSEWPRMRWLDRLLERTRLGARVLDVGCGNGLPATRAIAERFEATGVDVSAAQLERTRRNVPEAKFIHADLTDSTSRSRSPRSRPSTCWITSRVSSTQPSSGDSSAGSNRGAPPVLGRA